MDINKEILTKKREEIQENIKKVEMTYHQLLGQANAIDNLIIELDKNEEAPKE